MGFQIFDYRALTWNFDNFDDTFSATVDSLVPALNQGQGVDDIIFCSNDTVDRVVMVRVSNNGVQGELAAVKVPAGSGFDGVHPAVSIFSAIPTSTPRLNLASGADIRWTLDAAPSTGKVVTAEAFGGSY